MDRKWATWWGTRSVTSVKPSLRDLQVWPEFTASRECRQVQEPLFVQLCSNDTHFSLLPSSTFHRSFPRGFRNLVPGYDTDITFLLTFFRARSSNASSIRDVESIEDRWSRLTRAVDELHWELDSVHWIQTFSYLLLEIRTKCLSTRSRFETIEANPSRMGIISTKLSFGMERQEDFFEYPRPTRS